jgi:activator of 2-hydroxyglutaryl-CoA dehydratase
MADYRMNSKCAGTGTFLQPSPSAASVGKMDELARCHTDTVINSYTVFAGTEVIERVKSGSHGGRQGFSAHRPRVRK